MNVERWTFAVLAALLLSSCSTPALSSARHCFYAGRLEQAEGFLDSAKVPEKDRVLFLMERGMVRQARGEYEESMRDFLDAAELIEQLETYSLSKGATSLVVNDGVQDFRGAPYERTLLHAFCAKNYLAQADWDDAAVEARQIIWSLRPEKLGGYPQDAYSRYVAGLCLELIDDRSNAALEYRLASGLLRDAVIDEKTGHLMPRPAAATNGAAEAFSGPQGVPAAPDPWPSDNWDHELVCLIALGRPPWTRPAWDEDWRPEPPTHAEILHQGEVLGRSWNLADTGDLAFETMRQQAAVSALKTTTRVVLKEAAARAAAEATDNAAVGELVRWILIGLLEQPDIRRWETLPRWLQVARVPCPADLKEYDVIVKNPQGRTLRAVHVEQPIVRRGNLFVSWCRDLPNAPPPPAGRTPPPAL